MTKIHELLRRGRTYSFEFFPPKTDDAQTVLVRTLRDLQALDPSFVSVTYGAGGSTRERTHDLVVGLHRTTAMNPMAHLTCACHSRLELAEILVRYAKAGIDNLMALAGDPPRDAVTALTPTELHTALELVELARAIADFSVGVAAHPEGHPRSPDLATDRRFLAQKLARADFAVTQFFFEVDHYLSMVDDLAALGVDKPVLPGIMPVLNLSSIARMAELSGASLPSWLVERVERADRAGGAEEVRKVGIAAATELCQALLDAGAPGLHFITMNRSSATREIYVNLGLHAPA